MVAETWTMAQQSVVGSVLIDPRCVPGILQHVSPNDFSGGLRTVMEAVCGLMLEGKAVDPVTILDRTGQEYKELLLELMKVTPTAANAEEYAEIVAKQAKLAQLTKLAGEIAEAESLEDALAIVQRMADVTARQNEKRVTTMQEALTEFFDRHQREPVQYIPIGLPKLDKRLTIERGDVVVLGGYPSDGKSLLMFQWAYLLGETMRVGIFSLETKREKMEDRMVTHAVPGLQMTAVKHNALSPHDWSAIVSESKTFTRRRVDLIQAAGMTAAEIVATAIARRHEAIFIDYLQLIRPAKQRRGGTRAEEVAEISMTLATMARRHGILVVELSQLSRPENRSAKKTPAPTLASLRESGQLEQDADVVMLLYRTNPTKTDSPRQLHVAKNKDGETGLIGLVLDGQRQTFREAPEIKYPKQLEAAAKNRKEQEEQGEQEELPL